MFSIRIYIRILVQVVGIVVLAGLGITGIFSGKAIILGGIGMVGSWVWIGVLVSYLNTSNRRVQLFLDAIEDNESMLFFPENSGSEEQRRLHASFNRVNTLLTETKLKNREQEHFYQALLQHIPGGVISWDKGGKIKVVNEVALRLLGLSFLRYRYQIEQMVPNFPCILQEAFENGAATMQIGKGTTIRPLSLSLSQVILRGEEITIVVLKDIGRELSRKEFESWEKLTHVLTHEIMNSIAPIVSLSGTLLSYFQTKEAVKKSSEITDAMIRKTIRGLDTIKSQGQSLIHFTDSYRRLSYLQPPVPHLFSLTRLLRNLQLLHQTDLERQHIHLMIDTSQQEIEISADEELLSQVLINLLKNAMQALEGQENGQIYLRARHSETVLIEITDNGPGIPRNILEDIFIPFFTTKTAGTGIGLSLSRQIIRMHGGDLQVTSEPYVETRFSIVLPIAPNRNHHA